MNKIVGNVEIYCNEKTFDRRIVIDGLELPRGADATIWFNGAVPQMDISISIPVRKLVYNGNTVVEFADEEIEEIQKTDQGNSDKN